jgi:hypothetical protein
VTPSHFDCKCRCGCQFELVIDRTLRVYSVMCPACGVVTRHTERPEAPDAQTDSGVAKQS